MEEQNAANIMSEFVEQQTKSYLKTEDIVNLERLSIDWSLSILNYLDNKYQTNYIDHIISKDWWLKFEEKLQEIRFYEAIRELFTPEYHVKVIDILMERIIK